MPTIDASGYAPPLVLSNGHVHTVYAVFRRQVGLEHYRRERIDTPDEDFLDLDWLKNGASRLAVLSHGLEGSSHQAYVLGMARALTRRGWDVLAWNYRGCSGSPNRKLGSYHSGATGDLDLVVRHALERHRYRRVALVGFSLGGNLTLKYVGERGDQLDSRVVSAVAFSVPCDLAGGVKVMERPSRRIYMVYFLRSLRAKIRAKMRLQPGEIDDRGFGKLRTFRDFDSRYTAPLHGFRDADDYYRRASSRQYLAAIRVRTLLVNAGDDPFLSPSCYPREEAGSNPNFFLEVPPRGGHVGFVAFNRQREYWSEMRAAAFLDSMS
ncbi:MAG: alpha/beta fold hydrolase [Acidobacteriota bacterium]|nr:MAG: alpha/beta fold hydrolase [Acidobacteriota bacterium]